MAQKALNADVRIRRTSLGRAMWKYKVFYAMIAVGVLYFIVFKYATMYGLLLAFKNFKVRKGIWGSDWVGLKNFATVFAGRDFWNVFTNTLEISLWKLILGFPAPIILALLLNELRFKRFKNISQSLLYLPHFISWTILGGIFFGLFSSTSGAIPRLILKTTGNQMPSLITDPNYIRGFLYLTNIWRGVGWSTIIYMAAITGIDGQLYEAAFIDGATRFQQVFYVTLPAIMPTIVTLLVLDVGGIMHAGFDQIFNLQTELTRAKIDVIDTYVYRVGLQNGKYEYATVFGITKSVINCVLLFLANWVAGRIGESPL